MNNDVLALYSAFLDGHALRDSETITLRSWILESEENATALVEFAVLHGAITDRLMLRRLLDDLAANRRAAMVTPAMLVEAIEDIESSSPRVTPLPPPSAPVEEKSSSWRFIALPLAAAAVVLVGSWAIWQGDAIEAPQQLVETPVVTPPQVELPVGPPPAVIVAHVGLSFDAVWANREPLAASEAIVEGERLRLVSGELQLDMAGGATLILEGPAEMVLKSDSAVDLVRGKVAVRIDGAAESFIVDTPTTRVLDLGTEFGVECGPAKKDRVMVFDGAVALADSATAESDSAMTNSLQLPAGYEVALNPSQPISPARLTPHAVANDRYFLRPDEIDVRRRALAGSPYDQRLAEHYQRLRIDGLMAFQPFDPGSQGREFSIGMGMEGIQSEASVGFIGAVGRGAVDVHNGPAFVWLDTSDSGFFSRGRLLNSNQLIGASGSELWLTWTAQRMQAKPDSFGSAGVSLMFGDRSDFDEPIFIGRGFGKSERICLQSAWGGALPPNGQRIDVALDMDPAMSEIQSREIDDQAHCWLMRIEFKEGADRVSAWIDEDLSKLDVNAPQGVIDGVDVEFDRLRLAVNRDDETWRFSDFAAATKLSALQELESVGEYQIDRRLTSRP